MGLTMCVLCGCIVRFVVCDDCVRVECVVKFVRENVL